MTQPDRTPAEDVTFAQVKIFARNQIHAYLGISELLATQHRMEQAMAKQNEALDAVTAKVSDVAADTRALVEQLQAEKENLSPAGQEALDRLNSTVDALDAAVGDADGSDTPAPPVEEPTEPHTPTGPEGQPV